MPIRSKTKITILLILSALSLNLSLLNVAMADTGAIRVPSGAEEIRRETRRIAGGEFVFHYYASSQDSAAIKDFYNSTLPKSGWQEKNPLKELKQVPNFQVDSSLSNALEQNLIFEKDGEMVIVNFLPSGTSSDGKTRFTVAQGKIDLKNPDVAKQDFVPVVLTKPRKDIAPVYPGASLISLNEGSDYLKAGYFTRDDIETAASFYRNNMGSYGWNLTEEKPIQEMANEAGNYDIYKYCPTCPKDMNINLNSIKTKLTQLKFSNDKQDACAVTVSSRASTDASMSLAGMTVILVNYEQKKK